jgi:hypothetical protein
MTVWYWIGKDVESESYVTTDGQLARLSWNEAPIWGLRPDFYYCWTVAGLLCGALSLTRGRDCHLQLLLSLTSAVILGSESHGNHNHILLSQIRDFPFRHLLRLAGLWWRYLTLPPHRIWMWKWSWSNLRHYSSICLDRLRGGGGQPQLG